MILPTIHGLGHSRGHPTHGRLLNSTALTNFSARFPGDEQIDPVSNIGANASGWTAEIVLPGITDTGQTVDPTKVTVTVQDPGFDTSGNATTVTRTLTGVAHVRRQHPNGNSKIISTDGSDLTVLITLDDWVYTGSTITNVAIAAGFYTGFPGGTGTVTNESDLAYPIPLWAWSTFQSERATASTFAVEGVTFHRHARSAKQVACVRYQATDGTNTGTATTVSTPTLSTLTTSGFPPEVWSASVDVSGLTQGAEATVNATIYPFIGSTAYSLSASGPAWPTHNPGTVLRFTVDRTGGYGGAYAYVDVGASGGTVSATPATAAADPYPTIAAALTAVQSWNNTNKSHNDVGGATIRLMDDSGAVQTHNIGDPVSRTGGTAYCVIEADPDNAAECTVTIDNTRPQPAQMKWRNLRIKTGGPAGATSFSILGPNNGSAVVAVEGCTIEGVNNRSIFTWYENVYIRNTEIDGVITTNTLAEDGYIHCHGVTLASGTTDWVGFSDINTMIGCDFSEMNNNAGLGVNDNDDGRIIYNSMMHSVRFTNTSARTMSYGVALVQVMVARRSTSSLASAISFYADGDLTTITNMIEQHCTGVGERCSRFYNDVVGADVSPYAVQKFGVSMFNVWDNYNIKTDNFSSGAGAPGTWAMSYNTGNIGNVSLFGTVGRNTSDAPTNDATDNYMGEAWLPSSEYNLSRTETQANIFAMFTDYAVDPDATASGEYGDYTLTASATPIRNRVPSGRAVLGYDLAGNARANDGTGAAGCYEYVA